MSLLYEDYLFHRIDISKKPQCKHVKHKRAFQFLHLFLLQRTYGLDMQKHSLTQRSTKQQYEFEVFLGGSCNPTTWRYEQAIPYFTFHSISYYNPQVANWTPDLVDIEHRAKESAPLLFFVIDHSTRSLAAIAEVCYLAARGRNIIVVLNRMLDDKSQTKFLQQKNPTNDDDDENDYKNACQARQTLRQLLQIVNIPVFDNVRLALECALFMIKNVNSGPTSNESDDDGYSSHRTSSRSPSPIASDFGDSCENQYSKFHLPVLQSVFSFCTLSFRFIQHLFLPSMTPPPEPSSSAMFDLYIAFDDHDFHWLDTTVFPVLEKLNVNYLKRENPDEDFHLRKRSRLLYYLINDHERLSNLLTELAFVIGERQHHIIVYLQLTINENSDEILSKTERQDIERSRKYLDNLAKKENIVLYQSREQSWQHVLTFYHHD